jgi:hypothetical protein
MEYHKALADLGTNINLLFTRWGASLTPVVVEMNELANDMLEILRTGGGWKKLFSEIWFLIKNSAPTPDHIAKAFGFDIGKIREMGEANIIKNLKFAFSPAVSSSAALAGSSGSNITNNFNVSTSGVSDPEKASKFTMQSLERVFSNRYRDVGAQKR